LSNYNTANWSEQTLSIGRVIYLTFLAARFLPKTTHLSLKTTHLLKLFDIIIDSYNLARSKTNHALNHLKPLVFKFPLSKINMLCKPIFKNSFINQSIFMYQQFYAIKFFFISLLLSIGIGITANGQNIAVQLMQNYESPLASGDGSQLGDVMVFKVQIYNYSESAITGSALYAPIPAGTSYVPGTTILNGAPVSDINGKMPFNAGGLINSPGSAAGVIPVVYDVIPEMEYAVKVTANAGEINNYTTLQGTTSSGSIVVKSDELFTPLAPNSCGTIYQSTASTTIGTTYNYIRTLSTTNGTGGTPPIFTPSGPCYNIVNGVPVSATPGTVLTDAQAIAFDPNSNRIYFINRTTNNPAQDLCYLDLNASPVAAYKYIGYPLETNTAAGYNIDRMTFGADGYGYALTANGQDLIRFSIDPATNLPVIQPLGPLVNDPNNGTDDVLASTGGDLVADGSGKLYLLVNTNRIFYRINPANRVATSLGIVRGAAPAGSNVTALAADEQGKIYMGGAFQNVYILDLAAMSNTSITGGSSSNVYKTGDYTSCILPVMTPKLEATKTYTNTTGNATVSAGDPIEFTIVVTNTGNTTATAVKLFDAIPPGCHYIPNSTTSDGVAVPDIGGAMPFSVSGGGFISTRLETAMGIVKPQEVNKVVIKFKVTTDENVTICNRASLTFTDPNDNVINILSSNQYGNPESTCFYSNKSALIATKKWRCPLTNATMVVAGDPVEYIIEVTNTGSVNSSGVWLYDAIPANSNYMPGTTMMNGVAVSDIGGVMPFAVSGGQQINSAGASAGVITPGTANKVTITFWVKTNPGTTVCNQAAVIINNVNIIYSDDTTKPGTQDATCFYSDVPPLGRKAVNGTAENEQPAIIESVHVQPNPFINDLNLQVQSNTEKAVQVRLIDFYGRTVYATSQKFAKGVNSLNVHLPAGLSSGIYLLEVSAGNKRLLQKKLIKQ
jgi:uncharacterized repeat protein (TIGR01451 family)